MIISELWWESGFVHGIGSAGTGGLRFSANVFQRDVNWLDGTAVKA
ncbi:MAG: hypothetical protein U1G07_02765 [Verrucomicrobiota bacterium]